MDTAVPTVVIDDIHVSYRVRVAKIRNRAGALPFRRSGHDRPDIRRVQAVRGITLTAFRGDSIGVVGDNGSGKSTTLRAIAGLIAPDRGRVYTCGQPALLGVDPGLMKDLSGERNIVLGCLAMGMTRQQVREAFDEVVEFSGLGDSLDLPLRTYSTGMAQRLRFAISTARPHDVLLIDEALATGDAEFRHRSAERIARLRAHAGTVVLVSHTLQAVLDSCNRAIWIEGGRIRQAGAPEQIVAAYRQTTAPLAGPDPSSSPSSASTNRGK